MPSFQGQVTEEQLLSLVAYIKSLSTTQAETATAKPPATGTPQSANPVRSSSPTPPKQYYVGFDLEEFLRLCRLMCGKPMAFRGESVR